MDGGLNTALIVSLILISTTVVILITFVIHILNIVRRILLKIEVGIDNFSLTQDEIKLKILTFIEEILNKIKNHGKGKKRAGEITDEKNSEK